MATRKSVPILLLTGFLGSGKTTLLGRWLRDPEFAGALAIINELGEVGLDDRLARTAIETPLLLENGCACCVGGEDLAGALETMFWDRLHRRIPDYSRVIVETTGLADPRPILDLIANRALIAERYHVEGVVAIIDARSGPAQIADFIECRAQLDVADVAVISKADLADDAQLTAAHAAIIAAKPGATVLESRGADLSAANLLGALAGLGAVGVEAGAVATHTPGVTTAFADLPGDIDPARMRMILGSALADFGSRILRVKGLARATPDSRWMVIQVAPDHAIEISDASAIGDDARPGLTIIARDIPATIIAARLTTRLAPGKAGMAHAV